MPTRSLKKHLQEYGIRHFQSDQAWLRQRQALGASVSSQIDRAVELLQGGSLQAFSDAVADPSVSGHIDSLRADVIFQSGTFIESRLAGQFKILDLGCATGYLTTWYALCDNQRQVLGVDFAAQKVAEAERRARDLCVPNVRFVYADFTQALPPGSYDAVVDSQALRWDEAQPWEDLDRALPIIRGVLADDGILVSISNLGDEVEAERFASAANRAGLAVESVDFVYYADLGDRGAYPALVAAPRSSGQNIKFADAYAKARRVLHRTTL